MNKYEKERFDYCPKTISQKHVWRFVTTNKEQEEKGFMTIGMDKCFACEIVNDIPGSYEKE